jgi:hypothetical protein
MIAHEKSVRLIYLLTRDERSARYDRSSVASFLAQL